MPSADLIHGDRRAHQRYALKMALRFLWNDSGSRRVGGGCTTDLSREGIRFFSDGPAPQHADVQLRIEWPFLLQGVCPLELRVWGRVLRERWAGDSGPNK